MKKVRRPLKPVNIRIAGDEEERKIQIRIEKR